MRITDIMEISNLEDEPFASKEEELEFLEQKKIAFRNQKYDLGDSLSQIQTDGAGRILSYAGTDDTPEAVQNAPTAYGHFDLHSYVATPALVKHPIRLQNTVRYWVPKTEPILVRLMKNVTKKISKLSWALCEIEVRQYELIIRDVRKVRAQRAEQRKIKRTSK
jgi:hypothetical protein